MNRTRDPGQTLDLSSAQLKYGEITSQMSRSMYSNIERTNVEVGSQASNMTCFPVQQLVKMSRHNLEPPCTVNTSCLQSFLHSSLHFLFCSF